MTAYAAIQKPTDWKKNHGEIGEQGKGKIT